MLNKQENEVFVVATILTRHKRKTTAEDGKRLSAYEQMGDGTIEILQTIDGQLPAAKKKPLAVNFTQLPSARTDYLRKGTHIQLRGTIQEITKTQDLFMVNDLVVQSLAGTNQMVQSLGIDPQTKRNELITEGKAFTLAQSEDALLNNQEIQLIHQELLDLGYQKDLETAYLVETFFKRRIKRRNMKSVAETIHENPWMLMELGHYDKDFTAATLLKQIKRPIPKEVLVYAEAVAYMQKQVQAGDSFVRLPYLWGAVKDAISKEKNQFEYLHNVLVEEVGIENLINPYAKMTKVRAKTKLSHQRDRIINYYAKKIKQQKPNDPDDKIQKAAYDTYNKVVFYLQKSFFSEYNSAIHFANHLGKAPFASCLEDAAGASGLDPEQTQCLMNAFQYKASGIIGGAGTGKTRIISEIVQIAQRHHLKAIVLAPSAKAALHAAHEIEERIGNDNFHMEYQTIHRFATVLPEDEDNGENGDFVAGKDEVLDPYQFLIIDEMSMCSLDIFVKVMKIVSSHPNVHLVLVGDDQQLPAIGAQFFHQICDGLLNDVLPIVKLTKNHRADSDDLAAFVDNVRNGHLALPSKPGHVFLDNLSDSHFIEAHHDLAISPSTMFLVNRKEDAARLNTLLRGIRLKKKEPIGSTGFFLHDPVITNRNDYAEENGQVRMTSKHELRTMDVYNGTSGTIESYDEASDTVQVRLFAPDFPAAGTLVPYHPKELALYLLPAYALTVHKAQGSQAENVVYIVTGKLNITRNSIYTAVTRAEKTLHIVGPLDSLTACMNKTAPAGQTFWAFRVLEALQPVEESTEPVRKNVFKI